MAKNETLRTLEAADLDAAWALGQQAFNGAPDYKEVWLQLVRPDDFEGLFEGDRLVAQTQVWPFGQHFGGRRVEMGAVAGVAVAPDARGRGAASRVMQRTLLRMRERGQVISALFPATTSLYRGLGYEIAGSLTFYEVAPSWLRDLPRPAAGRVRPATPDDLPAIEACYQRMAKTANGTLDRGEFLWKYYRLRFDRHYAYVATDDDGEVVGAALYEHADNAIRESFDIRLHEIYADDADALAALWWTIGSSATMVPSLTFRGAPLDPLQMLLPEYKLKVKEKDLWMLRILDLEGAIAQRGHSPALSLEVDFEVQDERLPENGGAWRLRVEKGAASVERIAHASLRLDIGALSALYAGATTCAALANVGRLAGGTPEERALLDGAFAGDAPYMVDDF